MSAVDHRRLTGRASATRLRRVLPSLHRRRHRTRGQPAMAHDRL